ncbi:conserved hypothetical protein [Culex quinquefasciatus]|uniref:Uncharacterized protein n=1 Tax=Culex quinquefasciatus TaxID=7176 RepID=B0X0U3_CULQU|nr:conserved hypothetical protein [Culex quinquefasciatus]|eukprot:XP_001863265.1 conserved hypothetical protein [Culex quinquefasciatus]
MAFLTQFGPKCTYDKLARRRRFDVKTSTTYLENFMRYHKLCHGNDRYISVVSHKPGHYWPRALLMKRDRYRMHNVMLIRYATFWHHFLFQELDYVLGQNVEQTFRSHYTNMNNYTFLDYSDFWIMEAVYFGIPDYFRLLTMNVCRYLPDNSLEQSVRGACLNCLFVVFEQVALIPNRTRRTDCVQRDLPSAYFEAYQVFMEGPLNRQRSRPEKRQAVLPGTKHHRRGQQFRVPGSHQPKDGRTKRDPLQADAGLGRADQRQHLHDYDHL